ncbi:acetolactate synthase large subunit [Paracoccus sanguinis]|uniref:acetolactate synthase large subunit n=1 Tax=Paracoccus sanguinis TaxID=1545044 RepID=UPI0014525733|nr:acetolactate synthase large subunit [Paracoccus sanguinis]QJD16301.1 acetolactate synthase large subunit [Paracoccus sanguinis]
MNGAESVVRSLHAAGTEVCFANPGTSEMQFVDALDRTRLIHCVLGLFEGVVTGAADGYGRMAGKPAVTLLHLAPGFANGAANLHNAKKGRTPVLNLVGDHAVRHARYDAPLTADVAAAVAPFSDWVGTGTAAATLARDAMAGLAAASGHPGGVATLILPADLGWEEGGEIAPPLPAAAPRALEDGALDRAVALLGPGCLLLVGGTVLERPEALALAAGIADRTGAEVMAPGSNRRLEMGRGRVEIARIPYPIDLALGTLARFDRAVLVEAVEPVAFFAYPDRPSLLLPLGTRVETLAGRDQDGPAALAALADLVGARAATPPDAARPVAPQAGPLRDDALSMAIAAAIPDHAIVIDERLTRAQTAMRFAQGAGPQSWLSITGGSIGIGIPLAAGAAIACPDRPVVALQADGSAMYTLQGLWTQAREQANVTTIILANRSYEILKGELMRVGANPGPTALHMLDLRRPELDFVQLARGMGVPAVRVEDAAELHRAIAAGVREPGPMLIEAVLV